MQYANLGKSRLKASRLFLSMMTYGTSKWHPWVLYEETSLTFIKKMSELTKDKVSSSEEVYQPHSVLGHT